MNHRPGIEHWILQWAQQQINDGLCLDLGKGGGRTSSYHVDNAPDSIHRYMLEQTHIPKSRVGHVHLDVQKENGYRVRLWPRVFPLQHNRHGSPLPLTPGAAPGQVQRL